MSLTPQEAAALLAQAENGELSLDGEQGAGDAKEPEQQQGGAQQGQQSERKQDEGNGTGNGGESDDAPEGAPIASKSGTYTIPYEKLVEARDRAQQAEARAQALEQQLAELSAKQQANIAQAQDQAQARADAGQAQTSADKTLESVQGAIESGADVSLFGDFSAEAMANGMRMLAAQAEERLFQRLKSEQEQALTPYANQQHQTAEQAHQQAILSKHADAHEIVQSAEYAAWLKSLPSFMRSSVESTVGNGSAAEIVEVLDTFKAQHKPVTQDKPKAPEVPKYVPNSLSDVAGAPHTDVVQQTLESAENPASLLDRMAGMTPEQLERVMNAV
ncbi:hypothetical protein [Corticibacter populi]|nr:hypothetical protein [Corticibacter populi]RZS35819.1 hypothetical protein EV687_0898 [Corticibacter populi]